MNHLKRIEINGKDCFIQSTGDAWRYAYNLGKRCYCYEKVKWYYDSQGYLVDRINGKSISQHRLIALAFIPNPYNLPTVDHINHHRDDNSLSNLRWADMKTQCNNKCNWKMRSKAWRDKRQKEHVVRIVENGIEKWIPESEIHQYKLYRLKMH